MTRKLVGLSLILWLATIGTLAFFFIHGHTAPGSDGRISVMLQAGEKDFVLGEMRTLLTAVRDITTALAENDRATVIKAARSIGVAAAHDAPPTLLAKLPMDFKRMAMPLHEGFDALAKAAEDGEAPAALTARLGQQLDRCASCHGAYRFN